MSFKWLLAFSYLLASVLETDAMTPSKSKPYTCRTFGSGVVQPLNGTLYHVHSNCPFTLTRFTHNRVECAISMKRGLNGLLVHVEIMINKIKTVLENGRVQVEATKSVRLPYDQTYQHVFPYGIYTKLRSAVLPLSVIWHSVPGGIDTLWIETEIELSSDMKGLCGNHLRLTNPNAYGLISESVLPGEPCVISDPVSTTNTDCRMFFSYTLDCLMHMTPEFIRLCEENIHNFEQNQFVSCSFFKEVVRQCGNSSYIWDMWRKITHCEEPKCAGDLIYVEEGAAFVPTCSNQKTDSYDLTSSCVCPNGLVLDNHQEGSRCVSVASCPCVFGDNLYKPGETRSTKRETCLCAGGHWKCTPQDLPPVCGIEGYFVSTFDGKQYTVRGGCSFVAAQGTDWEIIVNYAGSVSIKSVHLHLFEDNYSFADNLVLFGSMEISDLHESEHALVYWQSSMFVQVHTTFGLKLQVQMSPEIQLYISPPLNYSCTGLCGSNNGDTTDDFRTSSGIIESSAQVFAMSWSVDTCKRIQPPPTCIRSEYEIFAEEKCSVLTNSTGIFAACHGHIPTDDFLMACIQKTCTCASHPQQCLCLALSSYVKVCTSLGVEVGDWRKAAGCTVECPGNWEFSYNVVACNSTCRSLSGQDLSCLQEEAPVEGCSCPEGTHLNMGHTCSPKAQCECHYSGGTTPPGPAVIDGRQCICEDGQLRCSEDCGCTNGKVCVHCSENNVNTLQKTCGRLSKTFGSLCESGCYCPFDQYENHYGVCVPLENCTCSYSGNVYASGDSIKGNCKTCVCSHGQWMCAEEPCPGKCQVYGNGHYQTFDSKWFRFDGHCQYTLVEDDCGYGNGTFSVRVESVPCCDEALTCSRSVSLDVKGLFLLILSDMTVTEHVHRRLSLHSSPLYTVHTVGLYIVVSVPSKGITLIWDKHTWITVELQPQWRNGVCGLCGNFDSNEMNELQIKDSSVVLSPMTFGNSWKSPSPPCSDVTKEIFPCERHSYCASWAQRRCHIITGDIFKNCHLKVDPEPYYQACVQESCSCEFEGRFLGFCTAVAAYAEACSDWDICVAWRSPDLCPVYCDYYNEHDQCVWHYEACGKLLTCGQEKNYTQKLEGCYPRCPEERPYYDENTGSCTDLKNCTCSFHGTFIEPRANVQIGSEECYCQDGTIKCPPVTPPPSTSTPTTGASATTESPSTTITPSPATTTTAPTSRTLTTTPTPPTAVTSTTTSSTTIAPTTYSSPNTSDTFTTSMPSTTPTGTTTILTTTTATPTASTTATRGSTTTTITSTTTTPPPGTTTATPTTVNATTTTTTTVTSPPSTTTNIQTTMASATTESPSTTITPSPATTTTAPTSRTLTTTPTPPTAVTSTTTSSTTIAPTTYSSPNTSDTFTTPVPTTTSTGTTTILTTTTASPTASTTATRGSPTTITSTTTTAPQTTVNQTATTTTVPTTAVTSTTSTTATSTPTSMSSTIITPTTSTAVTTNWSTALLTGSTTVEGCECVNLKSKQKWQCGETWTEDCNHVACADNVLQLTPVQCPDYVYPHCPRGLVVNVSDGCCERPTCDCRCELYGDPHYISFQGVLFDFFDNCTYILVEEQRPLYNLTIAVDNFFCIPGLDGSCVKGVIVKYKGNTAILNIVQDLFIVQASLNDMLIQTPFEQFGMRFESTGYITTLFLPEIRSYVSLTPSFSLVVNLAMENFLNNTQGQCGVCGGGSCIRRGGQVEDDSCCEKTAHDWVYEDSKKPECSSAAKDQPCSLSPPTSRPNCSSPFCDLLQQPVFAECRKLADLTPIFESCEFDSFRRTAPCSALAQAAEECKKCGFLIEWRTLTNGSCGVPCPEGLVFKEYSLKMDDYCLGGVRQKGKPTIDYVAGCFCPSGKIRETMHSDICVDTCKFCKGPLGEPKLAGEVWQSNCHICSCNNQTLSEECSEIIPPAPPLCGPNQILSNRCCGLQDCVERTCSYKGNVYKVGETWRDIAEPCKSFICNVEGIQTDTMVCPTQDKEKGILDEHHCCFTCTGGSCAPVMASLNVTVGQCSSELQMPVCDGLCRSHHRVVLAGALQVQQSSSCCRESSSEYRSVALKCSDQTNMTHIYKHITRCECAPCGGETV